MLIIYLIWFELKYEGWNKSLLSVIFSGYCFYKFFQVII